MEDRRFYVYIHKRNDTGKVFYVGRGFNQRAYIKHHRNKYWHNIVNKLGYTVEIIIKNLTNEEANNEEIRFIKLYRAIGEAEANMTDGGEGGNGFHWTKEQLLKRSAAYKKKRHPNYGTHKTEEWKKNQSQKMKGKYVGEKSPCYRVPLTEEHKKHISDKIKGEKHYLFGKKRSDEVRHKLSVANTGKSQSEETKLKKSITMSGSKNPRAKRVIDISTGIIYGCIKDAAIALGITWSVCRSYLNGAANNTTTLRMLDSNDNIIEKVIIPDTRLVKIINIETNEIYDSIIDCANKLNIKYILLFID
jgi:hypothetical protein